MEIKERIIEPDVDLKWLIGKTIKRDDVCLIVSSVSIQKSGTVYAHAGGFDSFGWTFINSDGTMCGTWAVVEE
jgi:hypothetical protein